MNSDNVKLLLVRPTTVARRLPAFARALVAGLAVLCGLALAGGTAGAQAGQIAMSLESGTTLYLDANTPCTKGMRAQYIQIRFTNNTGASLSGASATLSGFGSNVYLAGSQAATLYLPTLANGANAHLYWFVGYTCTIGASQTLTITVRNAANVQLAQASGALTTAGIIEAAAGGNLVSQTLIGHAVGAITVIDVIYDFGGALAGEPYIMEVAGVATFGANCFQLVQTEVRASNVSDIVVGTVNRTRFTATKAFTGNKYNVTIRYSFRINCIGAQSTSSPYAIQGSGNNNLKYDGNFNTGGSGGGTIGGGAANPFVVTKTASPTTLGEGGTATFTITVRNTSAFAAVLDSIVDILPTGMTFASIHSSSQINAANSSSVPSANQGGTIRFRSVPGTGYPVAAKVGANDGTITLVYTVNVQDVQGTYTNQATVWAGLSNVGTAQASVTVSFTISLAVTPDGVVPPVRRVPGTGWSQTFVVNNTSTRTNTINLLLATDSSAGPVARRDSIKLQIDPTTRITLADAAQVTGWPASTARSYIVFYTVPPGTLGVQNRFTLTAQSAIQTSVSDAGWVNIQRAAPQLTLVKSANATTVLPGSDIAYTLTFTNVGTSDASNTVVEDPLPSELFYKLGSQTVSLPSGVTGTMQYSNDGGTSWTYTPVSGGCQAPSGYDACINRIRLVVTGEIPPDGVGSGTLQFAARVK